MEIEIKVKDKVLKTIEEVFDAVVNPDKISKFFVSNASSYLEQNQTIIWSFNDVGREFSITPKIVKLNEHVSFEWSASGDTKQVDLYFSKVGEDSTSLVITEGKFTFDNEGVAEALQQTQGWTDFICSLKAFLYCGVNLRNGRTVNSYLTKIK